MRESSTDKVAPARVAPKNRHQREVVRRYPGNPLLTAADWSYPVNTVFNAGATLLPDGTTLLLCRVEDRRGHSHLTAARSKNGIDGWEIDREPTLAPDPDNHPEEIWGIESKDISTRTVDTHMSRLRKKLSLNAGNGWKLSAIYQHGYRIEKIDSSEAVASHA